MNTIEDLFNSILLDIKRKRKKNKKFDGLLYWQQFKPILSDSNYTASKWKSISNNYYNNIMLIPEYYINGHGKEIIIEENHFLIQTVRIPRHDTPNLRKIMQIALNIGQYLGICSKRVLKNIKKKNYLVKKDYNIKLSNILNDKDIKKLELLLK